MCRVGLLFFVLLCPSAGFAGDIANVTVSFNGTILKPAEVRALIARRMLELEDAAKEDGVASINLQSVAYSFGLNCIPSTSVSSFDDRGNYERGPGYKVVGNLFIDVEPEEKTTEFVTLLNKKGINATSNYYQRCVPPSR